MTDFYSAWSAVPPNGGTRYRLHLAVAVARQDIVANTTTLHYILTLEKERSFSGFYLWSGESHSVTLNGVVVNTGSGNQPNAPWTGWKAWTFFDAEYTVTHDPDGTKINMPVAAAFTRSPSGWAIGSVSLSKVMTLPPIARATTPTITPNPVVIARAVDIELAPAVGTYTHDITWSSGTLSGTIGTGIGASASWTVPNVSGEFPGLSLFPIVITTVTKLSGAPIGSRQVTIYARQAPAAPSPTPPGVDRQFDIRARLVTFDVSDSSWAARSLVNTSAMQLADSASATATCTLTLSKLNALDLPDFSFIDIDVFNGTDWVFTNHRMALSRVQDDNIDPLKASQYTGTEFVDFTLGRAYTQIDYYWDGATNHAAPTTPGAILLRLITDAQARGWGPRIQIDFDATKTSMGEPWINAAVSRNINRGTPLSQVLSGLVSDGLVEYTVSYHDDKAWLRLFNPGTGEDFSSEDASPQVNLALANLTRAPRTGTNETQINRVTVAADNSVQVAREQAPSDPHVLGVLEGWVAAAGVTTAAAAGTIGDNALRDNGTPTNQRVFEFNAQDAKAWMYPYNVFEPRDWVLIPDPNGETPTRDRIAQVTINKTLDGIQLTIATGDLILSGPASLAKRQSAAVGGSIAGGNQTSPSPLDSLIPAAVVIDTITSLGYWNVDGAAKSAVTLTWDPVTNALNGADIAVALYEVWGRVDGIGAQYTLVGTTDQLTITIGGYDPFVDLDFRMRAQSVSGNFGEFSDDQETSTAAPTVDIDGPDLADLYTDGVGSIYAVWGGTLAGVAAPSRLAYVVAEVSDDGGSTYTQMGTPITAAGAIVINPNAYGDYFVRLRGYDRLGNAGTVSSATEIVTVDPHIAPPVPVAPTSLTSTPGAAWDASGFLPEAWFDLGWTAPTVDTDGNPVVVVGYDVFGLRSGESIERYLTSTTTTGARISVGNGETWSFRVKATSNYGGVSVFSAQITDTADATISAASAPSAPTLAQYAGILQIKWAGGGMVPQIKYVYALISTTLGGTYTRVGMPLIGAGEVDVPGLAPGDYYAKIAMVDELGQVSVSAASSALTLLPITGVTIQTSELANTGIKMTTAGITAYDASGNPTFILNAGTGEVWIAPYAAVIDLGASGTLATTGAATTGIAISAENSSFNTFINPFGLQIRNDQTPLSWWEADASDSGLVNFFSPRVAVGTRLKIGDYEMLKEAKATGSRVVIRYKGA